MKELTFGERMEVVALALKRLERRSTHLSREAKEKGNLELASYLEGYANGCLVAQDDLTPIAPAAGPRIIAEARECLEDRQERWDYALEYLKNEVVANEEKGNIENARFQQGNHHMWEILPKHYEWILEGRVEMMNKPLREQINNLADKLDERVEFALKQHQRCVREHDEVNAQAWDRQGNDLKHAVKLLQSFIRNMGYKPRKRRSFYWRH